MGTDGTVYIHLQGETAEKRASEIMATVWARRAEVLGVTAQQQPTRVRTEAPYAPFDPARISVVL